MFFNRQLDRIELYNLSNSHSSEAVDTLEHRLSDVFKLLNLKLHVLKKTIMHPIADKNFFAKMIYLADISCSHYTQPYRTEKSLRYERDTAQPY